jgi:O-ureido-D-serine cyclo-ligase
LSKVRVFLDLYRSKSALRNALSDLSERNRQLEREIAERRAAEEQVRHLAHHDVLTGIGNRLLFITRLEAAIARARATDSRFALAYLDIDGFKPINDNHGHAAGDQLLKLIANRLRANLRYEEATARFGGDEFAVILDINDAMAIERRVEEIATAVLEPYDIYSPITGAHVKVDISGSIGVALFPRDGTDSEAMIHAADSAMYAAKRNGGGVLFLKDPIRHDARFAVSAPRIALVSVAAARALDDDLAPLLDALRAAGAQADVVDWDDAAIDWSRFDLAVLRSAWDYTERPAQFLDWAQRVSTQTRLLNPVDVLRWNTDKHYLADLERAGVAIVPSAFVEPGADAAAAVDAFLAAHADAAEFVVKPAIGAGSRDAQRHARADRTQALAHVARLIEAGRSALLQPYLDRVDAHGETALIHFDGTFSHAIRKGPLLLRGEGSTDALFAPEHITARTPDAVERELAARALAAIPFAGPLAYARVDLIHDADGAPRLLELELAEPSLFFAHGAGSARRFAEALLARVETMG